MTKGDTSSTVSTNEEDGAKDTKTAQAMKIIVDVRSKIRHHYKINEVSKRFPFRHDESMNSVLIQELARFNNLIEAVHSSL